MPAPNFVGAGAGAEQLTTGSFTVSKTGCTAGNLIIAHMYVLGTTGDWSGWNNAVNIEHLDGTSNGFLDAIVNGTEIQLFIGRVTSNGTCSADLSCGASGEDVIARLYEFQGEAAGTTVATVVENSAGTWDSSSGTATTSVSDAPVVTNGTDRLACNFTALETSQAIGDFTGESGGDWTEAVAEYQGTTMTLQLQTAQIASATTIDGGAYTVGSSTNYTTIGTAIMPDTTPSTAGIRLIRSGLRW